MIGVTSLGIVYILMRGHSIIFTNKHRHQDRVGLMLGQRRIRWPNIETQLGGVALLLAASVCIQSRTSHHN